ncbi:uncharacterized protein ACUXAV_003627 [Cupriavidus metallidurans]|jgi:uncharacterized protein|uniref:SEL1-like repeat protein n=1 Tax=Cupriavidus TaxID=106589 RepID=UPI00079C69DA|nr:sel1 repeat family protein [Cupriavidus metallidurans]KWW39282.1 hypothetical protein AU374_00348 [Cupriavidus metallidurans]MDE4920502.1 sel1 repeat family protein [Cupriavidus metallidurans]
MHIALAVLLAALTLTACSKENSMPTVPDLATVRANLAFTCVYEADHLPPLDPEADVLFKYARYLQKLEGPKDFDDVARYYRIAAAHGHYKANSNLQKLVSEGMASSPLPQRESVALASQLIDAGVPSGYYGIGYYLNLGYGLKQDKEMALRYFRKAADLGNADAQFYVGKLLAPRDKAPEIARQMRQCAADQGHGEAASTLGFVLKNRSNYAEALEAFQKGVQAGNSMSAFFLADSFKGPPPAEELHYLSLAQDSERSRRYKLIWRFLIRNDGRNPKVPDIDQIVPLPPAKLPPWNGTFQWQKEQDAAVPPDKPSDELINRLSKAKNLDPATGLPLTTSAKTAQTTISAPEQKPLPLGTEASTGEQCPQRGLWCVRGAASISGSRREFEKGDILPPLTAYDPRPFAWMDSLLGMREQSADVTWELIAYRATRTTW